MRNMARVGNLIEGLCGPDSAARGAAGDSELGMAG
jgi:hypothetical protein